MVSSRAALCIVLCGLASCARSAALRDKAPRIDNAIAYVLPSGAGVIYMRIVNDGREDVLQSVESPSAADAQLHEVVADGELSTMRAAPGGFAVPAGSTLVLEHGGKHVMLFGVKDSLTVHSLEARLHFQRAGVVAIVVPVRHGIEMGEASR